MKYSINAYDITPSHLTHLYERRELFRTMTKTKKALHLTFVTVSGLKRNEQWGMIQNDITSDQLFAF